MKKMNPLEKSKYIEEEFRKYVKSTFDLSDKVYLKEFNQEMDKADLYKGPFISISLPFITTNSINELVEQGKINKEFRNLSGINFDRKLYYHQEKSLDKIYEGRNVVITTGTGSGKTESFLYPILNTILNEIESGNASPGIRALFLYPMNALVNDQIGRVREILSNYPQITYGFFTGETMEKANNNTREKLSMIEECIIPENELVSREEIRKNPPYLLFTNYSMLEYLLIRPNDFNVLTSEFMNNWKYVVLDEAHTYMGALGIEVSLLLRRLTGIANKKPQFILTSATLGNEKKDVEEIINFAQSLTSSKYEAEDIIFAKRVPLDEKYIEYTIEPEIYSKIIITLDNINELKSIASLYGNFSTYNKIEEILYDLLVKDRNVYKLYNILAEGNIKTFSDAISKINVEKIFKQQELIDFIQLIAKSNKDNKKLFDSKYHTFIRTLDGAFITLGTSKQMRLTRHRTIEDLFAFEIGVCKYCSQIYVMGKKIDDYLYQNNDIDIDENYGDIENVNVDFFLIKDLAVIDEDSIEDVEAYVVCSKCGRIHIKNNINAIKCECGNKYGVELLRIKNESSEVKNNITKCACCNNSTTNEAGIVSGFYLGKDQATAVVSQILYKAIGNLEEEKEEKKLSLNFSNSVIKDYNKGNENKIKQFISFSDSRQQASFFATFFEYNHKRFLRKRIIWEELFKNGNESIKVSTLAARLERSIEERYLIDSELSCHNEAWLSILHELLNIDGNNGAEGLGLFTFMLNVEDTINKFPEEQVNAFCKNYNITKAELIDIMRVAFNIFRTVPAMLYTNAELTPETRDDELGYRRFDNYIKFKKEKKSGKENGKKDNNIRSFIPVNDNALNQVLDYILKVLKLELNDAKKFLEILFNQIAVDGELFTKNIKFTDVVYQIDANKYEVHSYKNLKWYKCNSCGKITIYNVHDVCPTKECKGILKECDPDVEFSNNYYRNEYMKKPIERMVIKEHTAQLNRRVAKEYQKDFKNKKINILSCSTTFEMGVDIGGLETVFLRNVPPSPANYAQRAGRAGRRGDTEAFVLTFCGTSSHDYTYFNDPTKMVAGNIMPPHFKITNEKIILRHLLAASLGFFFKEHQEYYSNVESLVCLGGLEKFKEYINAKPTNLREYIDNKILDKDIFELYSNYKWYDKIISSENTIDKFINSINQKIEEFEKAKANSKEEENFGLADYYTKQIKMIKSDNVIANLSKYNVIPKYGFPVDVVDLTVYEKNGLRNDKNDLSRDLSIAISEYAPDSEIIVDNKKYTSRYITKPRNGELTRYYYYTCDKCEMVNIGTIPNTMSSCKYCNEPHMEKINKYFIEPIYGFATDMVNKESRTKKPKKTYSGDIIYLGNGKPNNDKKMFNEFLSIESANDDELLIMNSNPFYRCLTCGYTIIDKRADGIKVISRTHNTHTGYKCNDERLECVALGHRFKTDVVKIYIPILMDKRRALSTLYAVLEGISDAFDIERKDINGIINKNPDQCYELLIFDNVPGGAGHVKRLLNEDGLKEAFKEAYRKVKAECCDEETSCYNCLRNYNNQKLHKYLKRKYAKETLKEILDNI